MPLQIHFKPLKLLLFVKKVLIALILCGAFIMSALFFLPDNTHSSYELPTPSHISAEKKTETISLLNTNIEPSKLLLTHLEDSLLFFGVSDRPDRDPLKNKIILGLKNSQAITAYLEGSKIYLTTKRDDESGALLFEFAKDDSNAPFWISASYKNNQLIVEAGISKTNVLIDGHFTLSKTTLPSRKASWNIEDVRVDPTYLARKQVRWIGQDLFLKKHGGDLFLHALDKERLDFAEEYSCYVGQGSILIWKDHQWQNTTDATEKYPILFVKKIEERLMHLVLWSEEGDQKCSMTLTRYPEAPANSSKKINHFQYLGAKSWKEFLFDIEGTRVCLRQGDWWLNSENSWKRLTTPEEIDSYVLGKCKGELFIVDGVKRIKSSQVLVGHVFNPTRTKMWDIEIPMKQKTTPILKEMPSPLDLEEDDEELPDYPSLNQDKLALIKKSPPHMGNK